MAADTPSEPPLDLAQIEARLRADLDAIAAEIRQLTKPPEAGSGVQFGKRIGEGTTEAISRFTEVGVANDLEAIRQRTERALEKLADGSFGTCDRCGGEIAAGRLRVAPASPLCIDCARLAR